MHSSSAPFTGRKMLLAMATFFGVIIIANVTMMTFALNTHTGVVVPNSYVASQDFNARIADADAQRQRGWQASFAYDAGAATLNIADSAGAALPGLVITGVIGRPVSEAHDIAVQLAETTPGSYVANVDLGPGEWQLEATATLPDGREHHMIRDLYVRAPGR